MWQEGVVARELMTLTGPRADRAEFPSGALGGDKVWDLKLVQVPWVPLTPSLKRLSVLVQEGLSYDTTEKNKENK